MEILGIENLLIGFYFGMFFGGVIVNAVWFWRVNKAVDDFGL